MKLLILKNFQEPAHPFAYEYGTVDDYGRHSAKTETQDEYGVVHGKNNIKIFIDTHKS